MLSILIPTYNYQITNLVKVLHQQAIDAGIEFEILCKDDASSFYLEENKISLEKLKYVSYFTSDKNIGRTASRQFLCNKAKYDWLLFLDADVMPKTKKFIENYAYLFYSKNEVVFGGLAYDEKEVIKQETLRWKYGKMYEEVDAKERNKKPFQIITSGNFLIKKSIFLSINKKLDRKAYGLDNYFAALLKKNNTKVYHINNEAYHYGLENSTAYIKKAEEAIATLLWMKNDLKLDTYDNKLLSLHDRFKALKISSFLGWLYKKFGDRIKTNLLSDNPKIYLLQIYKLLYISFKDTNN